MYVVLKHGFNLELCFYSSIIIARKCKIINHCIYVAGYLVIYRLLYLYELCLSKKLQITVGFGGAVLQYTKTLREYDDQLISQKWYSVQIGHHVLDQRFRQWAAVPATRSNNSNIDNETWMFIGYIGLDSIDLVYRSHCWGVNPTPAKHR